MSAEISDDELVALAKNLALGRIFRLMSRPFQPGDIEDYERCRALSMNPSEGLPLHYAPNWARDRLKGAQGDD